MTKSIKLKKAFIFSIVTLLLMVIVGVLFVSVNQINADVNDELIILENSSDYENVVIAKNVANYIDKCKAKGMSEAEISNSIYSALNYKDAEIPELTDTEMNTLMNSTELSVQEMFFEVASDGDVSPATEKVATQAAAVNEWDESGINGDVKNKGWLSCKLTVYQSRTYDKGNTYYNKDEKIHRADQYGYVLENEWKWLKLPATREEDEFFVSWQDSIVEIAPEYYDTNAMHNLYLQYANQSNPDLSAFLTDLRSFDAYNYMVCHKSDGKPGMISLDKNSPLDISIARFKNKLPSLLVAIKTIEFHTRLVLRSVNNRIEDFFIDTGYGHKWLGFSGSIGIDSGGNGSFSIQAKSNLDEYNVNVRKAHVGPVSGWTYN